MVAGRYRLVTVLGEGAFGEVWEADDLVLGERVAIKRLRTFGPESPRTRREIATLRMLRIPGVVRLFDEGDADGCPFFVMEHIQGAPFPGLQAWDESEPNFGRTVPAQTTLAEATEADLPLEKTRPSSTSTLRRSPSDGEKKTWPWDTIAETVAALFTTLARVHAAGIIHRDIKPSNVLVLSDGKPVLVDFGLCLPTRDGADRAEFGRTLSGTPAYLSPEQVRGDAVDARADLYSAAVMIYETLSGYLPHDASTATGLMLLRATQRAVPLRERAPTVPAAVAAVVDQLLSPSPSNRPASAEEVLACLGLNPAPRLAARWPFTGTGTRTGERALRMLFSGRQRLFHLPEDAAHLLYQRTAGQKAHVQKEIEAWARAGVARFDEGKVCIGREDLDRLEAGFFNRREVSAKHALFEAKRTARHGRIGLSAIWLEEGLFAVRRQQQQQQQPDGSLETALLTEWTKVAFAERQPRALDRVLYEVCRSVHRTSPKVVGLEHLLRSAVAAGAFRGAHPALPPEEVDDMADPELVRWYHWVQIRQALFAGPAALHQAIGEAEQWAADVAARSEAERGSPLGPNKKVSNDRLNTKSVESNTQTVLAALNGFRGAIAYVQGRFHEAAAFHAAAADGEGWVTLRIAQKLNEAMARIEAFEPELARLAAMQAATMAAECRHTHFEGRAEQLLRDATYRTGAELTPDLELLEALADLGTPDTLGPACLTEAAFAYRAGEWSLARDLAGRATETWKRAGREHPVILSRALAVAAGLDLPQDERVTLATQAAHCVVPGIGIQALALLRRGSTDSWLPDAEVLEALRCQVPASHWSKRMDVLSVDEAEAALASRVPTCPLPHLL